LKLIVVVCDSGYDPVGSNHDRMSVVEHVVGDTHHPEGSTELGDDIAARGNDEVRAAIDDCRMDIGIEAEWATDNFIARHHETSFDERLWSTSPITR
jgi:hypothetical protein